jgi:selenocysteine lyase/cysteine desulfurase
VLTTEHDFYATHEALRLRAARDGVAVRRVRLYTDPARASVDEVLAALSTALTPRVRLVAVTWVHSGTGVKLPIRAIAELIRARNGDATLLCVDGVHGVGVENDPPDALGADFLVTGCHKWLFGPRGTGLIWGSPRGWDRFTPVIPTFERAAIGSWITGSTLPITPGAAATPGGYHSFEHRWALAEAFGFHTAIGRARVAQRTRALADRLRHGLAGIDGVTVHTPRAAALSSAITCCELRGVRPNTAVAQLRAHNVVASVTPYATELLRFGPSLVTDERDVDRALAAVRQLVG